MIRRKPEANRAADAGAGTHPLGLPGIPDADSRGGFSRRILEADSTADSQCRWRPSYNPPGAVAGGRGRWRAAGDGPRHPPRAIAICQWNIRLIAPSWAARGNSSPPGPSGKRRPHLFSNSLRAMILGFFFLFINLISFFLFLKNKYIFPARILPLSLSLSEDYLTLWRILRMKTAQ